MAIKLKKWDATEHMDNKGFISEYLKAETSLKSPAPWQMLPAPAT
jgi:hypothetical protein